MIRILLVDDKPAILDESRKNLEKLGGLQIETADSAEKAISILEGEKFDAIVSDYGMPGMDGIGFLKVLRGRNDRTPFIIFSGKERELVILDALNNGADFFIEKGPDDLVQYADVKHKILSVVGERRTEAAFMVNEARYRGVVEDQSEFICCFKPDNTIMFANAAFIKYYGSSSEIIGSRFRPKVPTEESARIQAHLASLDAAHPFGTIEHRTIMTGGEIRWQQWSDRAITDSQGQVVEYQSVGRDITDRVLADAMLRKYPEHLGELGGERTRKLDRADRFAAIGETASMVGHDLRNRLQVIVNRIFLSQMRIEQMSPEERAVITKYRIDESLEQVKDQSDYMNKIVLDLQDLARVVKVDPAPYPLRAFIDEVLAAVDHPKGIAVTINVDPAFEIEADQNLMRRVFANILSNAFQAIEGTGEVVISAKNDLDTTIIAILDTGVGMDEVVLAKVFTLMYTTKPKETGLGLAVSRYLLREQGGNLTLQSSPGEGTTALIMLPRMRGGGNEQAGERPC